MEKILDMCCEHGVMSMINIPVWMFLSKYKTCLPSEEQLREEIEIQKRFYYLQKKEDEELGENS